ncbi:MAG: NADH-quinone oxidoreductase subunit NuoH [Capsulimonadaceae bacterium]
MSFHRFCYYFLNYDPVHTAAGNLPGHLWWIEAIRITLRVLIGLFSILLSIPPLVWYERRLLGWMQNREGPNRVGPAGLLQPIADAVKLLFKEDMNPAKVDVVLFVLAPVVFLIPTLVIPGVIPWGPSRTWGAVSPDNSIGILYLLAWSSLAVYGIVLAGWSSNNKYSLLGGLRSSAQMISYELGMGLAVISVVLIAGSLNLRDIVEKQGYWFWNWNLLAFFPLGLIAMLGYTISMLAETNRTPFDLPEAETELVAGYHTEYTSMKFATFFMGEYGNMVIVSAINATLFWGGYHAPIPFLDGAWLGDKLAAMGQPLLGGLAAAFVPLLWLWLKIWCGLYFFIWVRATMPRLRYDMLMRFGWQGLLPVTLVNVLLVAVAIGLGSTTGKLVVFGVWLVVALIGLFWFASSKSAKRFANNSRRSEGIALHASAVPFRSGQMAAASNGRAPEPVAKEVAP